MPAGDEIGVGARNGVEQLAEDHRRLRFYTDYPAGHLLRRQVPGNF